ncbi:hypothetical protein HBH1_04603 [Herbaspirillum sp. BH-1]|uniref:Uncharacterized protein n=1 Tax=Herbaspirillum frisingense TaxID=92645 RepID=A0ABU1PFU6_9BURK|nr:MULTISPECIES: hypothetical protein [Herbaspirillum]MCI1015795.1 hypothetical protein [Herbaspirillum sp. C7C2]MDR6584811.1 hypothetical protein [Herbaspirillum frisingense]PLY57124.1 hypothetical protein HBH1_04603 [Herbaspirillum sp. BH-1]HZG20200.1 hypothetical protein [Herbaspirillum sp.]
MNTMNTATTFSDTGLYLKLKTRHLAVLGVTATFLAIRVVEGLLPALSA